MERCGDERMKRAGKDKILIDGTEYEDSTQVAIMFFISIAVVCGIIGFVYPMFWVGTAILIALAVVMGQMKNQRLARERKR